MPELSDTEREAMRTAWGKIHTRVREGQHEYMFRAGLECAREELKVGMAAHGYRVGRNPDGDDETVAATLLVVWELRKARESLRSKVERALDAALNGGSDV